jgi:hypothetical protein
MLSSVKQLRIQAWESTPLAAFDEGGGSQNALNRLVESEQKAPGFALIQASASCNLSRLYSISPS